MNKISLRTIRSVCKFLPPIISQQVREMFITNQEAKKIAVDFKRKSFTGGFLSNNTRDFYAFRFYMHGYYDWRNIVLAKKILERKKGDIIEVGANIGTETVSLAHINKYHNVHAFEPLPSNFQQLERMKKENKFKNLWIYNVLVGEKSGSARFQIPQLNNSGSGYIKLGKDSTKELPNFEVVTLDEKLPGLKSCSAIFIDVEGFEYQVLCGAMNIITRFKPFIVIEVNQNFLKERTGITVSFLYQQLDKMGYKLFYIQKMMLKEVNPHNLKTKTNKNWLCVPKEKLDDKKILSRSICLNALNPFISKTIF